MIVDTRKQNGNIGLEKTTGMGPQFLLIDRLEKCPPVTYGVERVRTRRNVPSHKRHRETQTGSKAIVSPKVSVIFLRVRREILT